MKTSSIISTIGMAFIMLISVNMNAQKFADLDKSPMDAAAFPSSYKESSKVMKIVYSRPQLKKRDIEKLAPMGKVWRTGANEAAELTIYQSVKFGGEELKPGTYTFYLIPGEDEWTAIISKDINVWGSYYYNEANDVVRTKVPVRKSNEPLEAFSIVFEESKSGADMHLGWGDVRLTVPFYFSK